jgi:hypothetical protein
MSRSNFRVVIPRNADDLIGLAELVIAKHIADGATSKLNDLITPDLIAAVANAKAKNAQVKQMRIDAETLTEELHQMLGIRKGQKLSDRNSLRFVLASGRDILLGHNKGEEQKLGDHGYVVNRNVRKPKAENGGNA